MAAIGISIAAVGGGVWFATSLKTFRPPPPEAFPRETLALEDVDARLWQDPFAAVHAHSEESHAFGGGPPEFETPTPPSLRHQLETLAREIEKLASELIERDSQGAARERADQLTPMAGQTDPDLVIMPVMVPGGSYTEDTETRRRIRHGVVSGLGRKGFEPDRAEHIGYVNTYWPLPCARDRDTTDLHILVPFEWYTDEPVPDKAVLVLWLDDHVFSDLKLIDALLSCLLQDQKAKLEDERITIRLIGPSNSTALIEMLRGEAISPPSTGQASAVAGHELSAEEAGDAIMDGGQVERSGTSAGNGLARTASSGSGQVLGEAGYGASNDDIAQPPPERDPPPELSEEDRITLVHAWMEGLDEYLDEPLSKEVKDDLWQDLYEEFEMHRGPAGAAIVAASEAFLPILIEARIKDSDPDWAERTLRVWRFEALRALNEKGDLQRLDASAILVVADLYLDDGLPARPRDGHSEADLVERLAGIIPPSHDRRDAPEQLIEDLAGLLQQAYPIEDSDDRWMTHLVEQWVAAAFPESALRRGPSAEPEDGADAEPADTIRSEAPRSVISFMCIYNSRATGRAEKVVDLILQTKKLSLRAYTESLAPRPATVQAEKSVVQLLRHQRPAERRDIAKLMAHQLTGDASYISSILIDSTDSKKDAGKYFVETIVPDDRLAKMLIEELERRHVDLTGNDHIALVGEWDTFYGREFRDTFKCAFKEDLKDQLVKEGKPNKKAKKQADRLVERHIHEFSYLRGLDGHVPGAAEGDGKRASTPKDKRHDATQDRSPSGRLGRAETRELRQPFGRSQFDYMRRLADRMRRVEQQMPGRGKFRAIGVTGSDVYDKQLVLQALRPKFPNAIFFTTDLDARLLHRDQDPWTRNLIIASSYGLQLNESIQGDIPPFRDVYQTSTFVACLLALGGIDRPKERVDESNIGLHLKPRLYEVGRSGAFDITPREYDSFLHPRRATSWLMRSTDLMWLGAIVLLSVWLIGSMSHGAHRRLFRPFASLSESTRRTGILVVAFLMSVIAFAIVVRVDQMDGTGEPVALAEGISIWPTELIRLSVVFFCIWCYLNTRRKIRDSDRDLCDRFGLSDEGTEGESIYKRWRAFRGIHRRRMSGRPLTAATFVPWLVRRILIEWQVILWLRKKVTVNFWDGNPPKNQWSVNELWREYLYRGRLGHRLIRVLVVSAILAALILILMWKLGLPPWPARGSWAYHMTQVVGTLSMIAVAMLVVYTADVTRLCVQFVGNLAQEHTEWPRKSRWTEEFPHLKDIDHENAEDYLDVLIIADRTEVIARLVFYPFIAISLMLLARNSFFDKWEWSWFMVVFYGILVGYAFMCAAVLRWRAERSRRNAIGRLRDRMAATMTLKDETRTTRREQIEYLIEQIKSIRRGAYAVWSQRPLVQSLIALGGVGLITLLDMLAVFRF